MIDLRRFPPPGPRGAAAGRPVCRALLRAGWRVRVHGTSNLPREGGLILAGNHSGALDGPLMYGTSPRPVHIVTKEEVFVGPLGSLFHAAGQIPISRGRPDRLALFTALSVLKKGWVLGVYPEGTRGTGDFATIKGGLAYLALRSGAPIQPVVSFGVRRPGTGVWTPPPPRARVEIVYGPPFRLGPPWPGDRVLPRRTVAEVSVEIRRHLLAHLAYACELTGRRPPEGARLDTGLEGTEEIPA